ncbi:MAG: adenine phosphoribosyltransferase [Candidatus Omnitrophica bacterium]|nr:adenine phosphoribosyltransferase [Candidatus Omnitrophota bacterium]
MSAVDKLAKAIRDVPDFPKKGILFKDITTVLQDPIMFKQSVDSLYKQYKTKKIDYIVCVEARGFIFGSALAYKLNAGLVLIRKKGKLPYKTYSVTYSLEYGKDTLEIHQDAMKENGRVLIIDDLLATGGTIQAVCKLINKCKVKIVGIGFFIELLFLKGRKKLLKYPIISIIKF